MIQSKKQYVPLKDKRSVTTSNPALIFRLIFFNTFQKMTLWVSLLHSCPEATARQHQDEELSLPCTILQWKELGNPLSKCLERNRPMAGPRG